jgi:PPR repeat family
VGGLPNTLCYNIVIKTWIRQRRGREAAEHADRLLEEMKDSENCRPDVVTYGCTLRVSELAVLVVCMICVPCMNFLRWIFHIASYWISVASQLLYPLGRCPE